MKILDLFCGDGGVAWGIHQAIPTATIVGVDKHEMAYYPFEIYQANAIDFDLAGYDFIWASPPCQAYSKIKPLTNGSHLALIDVIRGRLKGAGVPYCIETVSRKPLKNPIMLCGSMFGLGTYRHRYFETNFPVPQPDHAEHTQTNQALGERAKPGEMMTIVGHFTGAEDARKALGLEHFMPRKSLSQTIPPAYSKYILSHLPPAPR